MGRLKMQAEATWTTSDAATAQSSQEARQEMQSPPAARHAESDRPHRYPPATSAKPSQRQFGPPEVVRGCR